MADMLWRECANWLIRCQILPLDHRVTWQNAQVIDLANTLRDGVLLCQVLNKLEPGCIDLKEISLRPQMSQFLCMKNIRTFLQTCQNVFDLKTADLFEPYMLFDYTDFGRVLHTLSLLSKSVKAQSTGIRGFPSYNKAHEYYNDDIYRNLEDIANNIGKELCEIHTGFHSELFKACTSSQYKISDCFIHWKDKFVIYGEYCSNLPFSQELLDDLCNKNEIINQSVLRCQMDANEGKFKLRDLLSVPMQRVLKYHLLLKELLRNTPKTHEDYVGLEKALDCMLDISQYINEVKRDNETLEIIKDIQVSITDLDMPENTELRDYGRLLKDGELKVRSHDDNRLKNRYVFLFNNLSVEEMLLCLLQGEQYSYKEALVLRDYKVEDVTMTRCGSKDKWSYYWYLVHRQNKTAYTMYSKTEEMKRKWISAIEKALDNDSPAATRLTDHKFNMFTFDKPSNCMDCGKLLRGIFYQGYKCATCGIGVHKDCIATVRSCGAPTLPPRPMLNAHASSLSSIPLQEEHGNPFENFQSTHKPVIAIVKAVRSFRGDVTGSLSFDCDDIIHVYKKANHLWWEGRNQRTEEEGIFPVDYVMGQQHFSKRASYEDPTPHWKVHQARHQATPHESYVNLNLEEQAWFAGTMDRDTASVRLENLPSGTFLLRVSPKQNGGYAISLNYNNQVKHMRVCMTEDGQHFYLSESKYFKTIVELIKWYEENTLAESFSGLNIKLLVPYKKALNLTNGAVESVGLAVAIHEFTGASPNVLSLQKGDSVIIISKAGGDKGWWKGKIGDRVGYFPLAYVQELSE
ncbi:guanine nucleotide exchange factor VAV2-like [Limulus polyphemus]|uniref:Guanine nucleotide exchange factor VAV2-like n=1 Tax=Limulus polyphemus TaxID=6850 RepID=A0ABM1RUN2_LIMPO|nr:guanine nucleotide exchange factor VAV2-like [Limulus polyphemus]